MEITITLVERQNGWDLLIWSLTDGEEELSWVGPFASIEEVVAYLDEMAGDEMEMGTF